uniref:Uncharacterized protein n=1 Tax=Timema cristinae TaxID=61476 RepID=A0A7R9CTW4_TIMCR|nr:unnamed protein product [Timema cristinae]
MLDEVPVLLAIAGAVVNILEPGFVEQKGGYTQVYQTFSDQLRQTIIVTFVHHEPELVCQHQIHPEQHLEETVVECGHCIQFPVLLLHKFFLYVFVGDVVHLEQCSAILTPLPHVVDDLRGPVTYLREEPSRYLDRRVMTPESRSLAAQMNSASMLMLRVGATRSMESVSPHTTHFRQLGDVPTKPPMKLLAGYGLGTTQASDINKSCLATLSSAAVLSSGPGENTHMLVIDEKYLVMTWLSDQGQEDRLQELNPERYDNCPMLSCKRNLVGFEEGSSPHRRFSIYRPSVFYVMVSLTYDVRAGLMDELTKILICSECSDHISISPSVLQVVVETDSTTDRVCEILSISFSHKGERRGFRRGEGKLDGKLSGAYRWWSRKSSPGNVAITLVRYVESPMILCNLAEPSLLNAWSVGTKKVYELPGFWSSRVPPHHSPEYPPDPSPEVPPDHSPEVLSGYSPEVPPEHSPEVPPDHSPEVTPDHSPEVLSEYSPEVPPDHSPEYPPDPSPKSPPGLYLKFFLNTPLRFLLTTHLRFPLTIHLRLLLTTHLKFFLNTPLRFLLTTHLKFLQSTHLELLLYTHLKFPSCRKMSPADVLTGLSALLMT